MSLHLHMHTYCSPRSLSVDEISDKEMEQILSAECAVGWLAEHKGVIAVPPVYKMHFLSRCRCETILRYCFVYCFNYCRVNR